MIFGGMGLLLYCDNYCEISLLCVTAALQEISWAGVSSCLSFLLGVGDAEAGPSCGLLSRYFTGDDSEMIFLVFATT